MRRPCRISLTLSVAVLTLHSAMPLLLRWIWRVPRPDAPQHPTAPGTRVRVRGVGDKWLAGRFLVPEGRAANGAVLVMHGWAGHSGAMLPVAAPFTAAGFRVLLLDAPVLLVHGTIDRTVPPSDAHALLAAAPGKNVDLLVVEGADHRSDEAFLQVAPEVVGFVRSCFTRRPRESADPRLPENPARSANHTRPPTV